MRFPLWRRKQKEDLEEELRAHVDAAIRERVERGESRTEAEAAARREFGNVNVVRETTRDTWGWASFDRLAQDLRYGFRMMRRNPGFTLIVVFTLALGVGANTAIFSVIDALMLRDLPVVRPQELAFVSFIHPDAGRRDFYHPLFIRFREHSRVFAGVSAAWQIDRPNLTIRGEPLPDQAAVAFASGNFFSTLGVRPHVGRVLTPDDDRVPGAHPVAVLSYPFWKKYFSGSPEAVGKTFELNGTTFTVVGVAAKGFLGEWIGKPADLWVPFMMELQVMPEVPGLQRYPLRVVARLAPGVSFQQAEAASRVLVQQLLSNPSATDLTNGDREDLAQWRLIMEPAARGYSPQRELFARPLSYLMTSVGALLLIACFNVANLLLARSETRHREMALRLAIGAGRARILRQLMTEGFLLALCGGALGVFIAAAAMGGLSAGFAWGLAGQQLILEPSMDARILAFSLGLCMLCTVLFALVPAWRASKVSLAPALTERSKTSTGFGRTFGLGKALVVAQVALSLLILVSAGLMAQTLHNLRSQNLGFARQNLLLAWTIPGISCKGGVRCAQVWHEVQERIGSLPGVISAGGINNGVLNSGSPITISSRIGMRVEGRPPKPTTVQEWRAFVTPGFFSTMGVPLLAGRDFNERDNETSPPVVIINETMARHYFGKENPIGAHVRWREQDPPNEIVGVVGDFARGSPRAVRLPWFLSYFPYRDKEGLNVGAQTRLRAMMLAVRTAGDPITLAARVRQELRRIDPNLPILKINTVEGQLAEVLAQDQLMVALSGCFAAMALLLACTGLYGVMAYAVARRTGEMGIRAALGASPSQLLKMVFRESLWVTCAGVVVGLAAALATASLLSSLLFGVTGADPLTMAAAAMLMLAVASLAAYLPARRAANVDPLVALRCE